MSFLNSKDGLSRRELLKGILAKQDMLPGIDKGKCSGCGLCAVGCPTGALAILKGREQDTYQLLFRHDLCNACAACERSCPEHCLRLQQVPPGGTGEKTTVIFEDKISRCRGCGAPLFPQAMVRLLKSKIFNTEEPAAGSFDLCPSCRVKIQIGRETFSKKKSVRSFTH